MATNSVVYFFNLYSIFCRSCAFYMVILRKKQRSVNLDVPIKADIDETSKVLSLEFLEYIGEVRVSVVDANGNIVYEEIVDTQDVSSSIISLDECTSGSYGLYISDSENYAEGFFNL